MLEKENGIVIFTLAPDLCHRLQFLGSAVFAPLKIHSICALDSWLSSNLRRTIAIYEVEQLARQDFTNTL